MQQLPSGLLALDLHNWIIRPDETEGYCTAEVKLAGDCKQRFFLDCTQFHRQ